MNNSEAFHSIEVVKEDVINTSLVVSSVLGLIAYTFSNTARYFNTGFNVSLIFETAVIATLLIITFYRKKLSNITKAFIMVMLLLFLSLTDAYFYGLLSSTRVYLVLLPFYAIIYFPFVHGLAIYFVTILSFLIIGYFHSNGTLAIPQGYEAHEYIVRFPPWIIIAIHITLVGMVIMFITRKFFNTFSDLITALHGQNSKISENERNYREIFNSTNEAIFLHNAIDGKIYDVNNVMLKMYGYDTKEEVLKLTVKDISAKNDNETDEKAQMLIRKAVEEGAQVFDWVSKKKNGELFHSEVSLKSSEIGGKGRVLAVVRDITERKKSELALKESEERYRTIIEAFPEIIMVSDLAGNIVFANKRLEEVAGISPEDYINYKRKARIHPEDDAMVRKEIATMIESDSMHTPLIENRFIDAWGNIHWFSGIISKIYINNHLYLQTITRDITDKKRAEEQLDKYRNHLEILVKERTEELEATNEELSAANNELISQREELETILNKLQTTQKQLIQSEKMASLGVLAAGIAHELNNPLNFIKGGADALNILISTHYEYNAEIQSLIDVVHEGVKRAGKIVSGLNHYSRRNDKAFVEIDVHKIIENCLLMLQNQIKNNITVENAFTEEPFVLKCNEGKIHQAILNLLTNAVHAIDGKGKIIIKTSRTATDLQIDITDTGCGIPRKNLSKILDPFFTTKDPGKGTGLGLFITHNIVEEHGGSMHFESQVGVGTQVQLSFPVKHP